MSGTTKQATLEDLQRVILDLAEAQKKTEAAQQRTEAAQQKTECSMKEVHEAQKKTEAAQQKTEAAQQKTEAAQQKTEESLQRLEKSLNKAAGEFNNRWGEFMENLVRGDLVKLFRGRGIDVVTVSPRVTALASDGHTRKAEYDLVAVNGEEVVVVEVKTTLLVKDVKAFLKKLKEFKTHFPAYEKHTIYGGVAHLGTGKREEEDSAGLARERGLFVIQAPGGESEVSIMTNPPDFEPETF